MDCFHQTLKRWLTAPTRHQHPQLRAQFDTFREHYNHHRPHRTAP
ncbi:integrase core domain-containing protein [Microbacterium jiangjiandongii]